jgi:hypothetical protein
MRAATEQLPAFIFYLGAGGVLLAIVAIVEAVGDRADRARAKRRKAAIRRERRERVWAEVGRL